MIIQYGIREVAHAIRWPGAQTIMCRTREVAHANIGGPGTKTSFAILEKRHMRPVGQVPKRS